MKYKINKQKCTGCQACVSKCFGATKIAEDSKAIIINQEKLEQCGGKSICPFGAIERINGEQEEEKEIKQEPETEFIQGQEKDLGMERGQGIGAGRGRGLGIGPRDGKGQGRGGGNRRRW